MEIYELVKVLASFATALGVAIATWQIWRNAEQTKTSFEDSLNKEYRELMRRIPFKALIGEEMNEQEIKKSQEAIYNYLDFCNQQVYLRKKKRIRKSTWLEWQEGIQINMGLPVFKKVSSKVFNELPEVFSELQRVRTSAFSTDPAKWNKYSK